MFLRKKVRSLKETGHQAGAGNCAVMFLAPHKMDSTHCGGERGGQEKRSDKYR